jgi:hypothetical protein
MSPILLFSHSLALGRRLSVGMRRPRKRLLRLRVNRRLHNWNARDGDLPRLALYLARWLGGVDRRSVPRFCGTASGVAILHTGRGGERKWGIPEPSCMRVSAELRLTHYRRQSACGGLASRQRSRIGCGVEDHGLRGNRENARSRVFRQHSTHQLQHANIGMY